MSAPRVRGEDRNRSMGRGWALCGWAAAHLRRAVPLYFFFAEEFFTISHLQFPRGNIPHRGHGSYPVAVCSTWRHLIPAAHNAPAALSANRGGVRRMCTELPPAAAKTVEAMHIACWRRANACDRCWHCWPRRPPAATCDRHAGGLRTSRNGRASGSVPTICRRWTTTIASRAAHLP